MSITLWEEFIATESWVTLFRLLTLSRPEMNYSLVDEVKEERSKQFTGDFPEMNNLLFVL